MIIFLVILLAIDVAIFVASQFRYHGYVLADQICLNIYGMCDQPLWIGAVGALLVAASFTVRTSR